MTRKMLRGGDPVQDSQMATKKKAKKTKRTTRSRSQDRARVAGGQKYELAYTAKKVRKKPAAVRKAIKKVGNSRKKVTQAVRNR